MMHMRYRDLVLGTICLLVITACGLLDPTSTAVPAALIFYGDTTVISSPDTVARATPFSVRIRTFAGGCTRETARTDVTVNGLVAEIRPYDLTTSRRGVTCSADLLFLDHVATVEFFEPGIGLLRIVGVQYTAGAPNPAPPAIFERRIVVR